MKRRLLILAAFLLAGAVVNVGVAWGCAGWSRNNDDLGPWEPATKWPHPVPNDWPAPQAKMRRHGFGIDRLSVYWENLRTPSQVSHRFECDIQTTEAGWPLRTLEGVQWLDFQLSGPHKHNMWSIDFKSCVSGWDFIPLKPMWAGFVVNTVFYAVVIWLLIPGPLALRRFIRDRRGLCPACAYPRGESDVCSECGKSLPECVKVTT